MSTMQTQRTEEIQDIAQEIQDTQDLNDWKARLPFWQVRENYCHSAAINQDKYKLLSSKYG